MGFDLNLLILEPQKKNRRVRWSARKVLNVGRISSCLTDPNYARKNARVRAALYFFGIVYDELLEYTKKLGKGCIAPKFNTGKDEGPISYFTSIHGQQIPSDQIVLDHNAAPVKNDGHRGADDLVFAFPLVWVPCDLMVTWLLKGEQKQSSVKLRTDDTDALVLFENWKKALVAGSDAGSKALFVFESISDPNII